MTPRETLSLAPGVSMAPGAAGRRAVTGLVQLMLPPVSPGLGAALDALRGGEHDADALTELAGREGVASAATLQILLEALHGYRVLARNLHVGAHLIATLSPAAPRAPALVPRDGARQVLSRFAFTHAAEGATVLETPLSPKRTWLPTWHGPALVGALAVPRTLSELAAEVPGIPGEAATAFLLMLAEAGALCEVGPDGKAVEPEALATWEFHDLLFHGRTRLGRHERGYGATRRFQGQLPEPERKPPHAGEALSLEVPDLAAVAQRDPSFTSVLERRRSVREHGARPLSRAELAELLYRAVGPRQAVFPGRGEGAARPYPAGGALYEIEVYVVAHQCEGLEAGLYHYRPDNHALSCVVGRTSEVDNLLKMAASGAALQTPPQVLLVMTARFARMAWRYEAIAYSLMLKHVGGIFQTLYLVATAMGLAPCALGGGSAELFARASGLDPLVEGSVGEFLVGTRSPHPPTEIPGGRLEPESL